MSKDARTIEPPRRADHPSDANLAVPGSLAVRWDVIALHETNQHRAYAAALGVCWRGPGRPRSPWVASNPAEYAGRVLDELLERPGVGYADIIKAGVQAYVDIVRSMPTEDEVEAASGNSEAAEPGRG